MSRPKARRRHSLLSLACLAFLAQTAPVEARFREPLVRIGEVFAGANGDSRVQFIELHVRGGRSSKWGPQKNDPDFPQPRMLLTFHDASGLPTGIFEFPTNPILIRHKGHRNATILLATIAFEDQTGLRADYLMPPALQSADGMVCFRNNPANRRAASIRVCLSYGNYQGPEEPDSCGNSLGPPAPALVISGPLPVSLGRFRNTSRSEPLGCFPRGPGNADFELEEPSPTNSRGETAVLSGLPIAQQGENLFRHELFNGNGRTCVTCHIDANDFALTPAGIADRFDASPHEVLFAAEFDPALAELENACLMRGGNERGLILENIDGFAAAPVFRNPPHLLNIRRTAPYGLSAIEPDLRAFSRGAVIQHFPKTLARNADPAAGPQDFRIPSDFELQALAAFMDGIMFPADGNLDQNRMMAFAVEQGGDKPAIDRGRLLVGGTLGKAHCFRCHGGPTRSKADGSLGTGAGNRSFDTGVSQLAQNQDDACIGGPGDPTLALPAEAGGAREFETPPLIGVARTAPYFHDNSVTALRDAVAFYAGDEFAASPAGRLLPSPVVMTDEDIDDIVAFLEAISLDPSVFPRCDDGLDNDGDGAIDAPDDPGCSGPMDDSERELGLPCDDGIDNDGDRLVDFGEDPGCESPTDLSEAIRSDIVIDLHHRPRVGGMQRRRPQKSRRIQLALLGSANLDLDEIEISQLRLETGTTQPLHPSQLRANRRHRRDWNGDGFEDLILHFNSAETRLARPGSRVCLEGTARRQSFSACGKL